MAGGSGMERKVVNECNAYLENNGFAFRLKQSRFTNQIIDCLIDSKKYGYFAIECKSAMYKNGRTIYFSQYFTTNKYGKHQIETISDYIHKSGRKGYIFIEKRKGRGYKNITYAVPWNYLEKLFNKGDKGITWKQIRKHGKIFKPSRFFKHQRWSKFTILKLLTVKLVYMA